MKKVIRYSLCIVASLFFPAINTFAQATITGYVRTMTGVPIQGAIVKLVSLNKTAKTDADGFYDFANTDVLPLTENTHYSLVSRGKQLFLNLDQQEKVSITVFSLSGKLISTVIDRFLQPGNHSVALNPSFRLSQQLYLVDVTVGSQSAYYKMTVLPGNAVGLSATHSQSKGHAAQAKSVSTRAADSMVVTHPDYHGGLFLLNTRKVSETTGTQHFRMFSNDTSDAGWYAPPMQFNFTPHHAGVDYYKEKVPDWVATEQEVQREVFQMIYRLASEIPENKKYDIYKCNINANVSTSVASTGGNTLNFNPGYINGKPWYEIIGVQIHECVHSYQPYYSTSGASGFGEAICDAIRALSGFFKWPEGSKCRGGFQGAYQTGGKYWYYIELKHPGFIYELFKLKDGQITDRVKQITGESLDDMCQECESDGMPYTMHNFE